MSSPPPFRTQSHSSRSPATAAYEQPDVGAPASGVPTEPLLEHQSPAARADQRVHDPYAALRLANLRFYMAGWLASFIGQRMLGTEAIDWKCISGPACRAGFDPRLAVGLWLGAGDAGAVLSLPAGQLADRFNRRKILMVSQFLSAAMAAALAWLSYANGSLGWMYAVLFGYAVATAIGWPGAVALLPQIVPEEVFSNAATWVSSMFQVAAMAGPALGESSSSRGRGGRMPSTWRARWGLSASSPCCANGPAHAPAAGVVAEPHRGSEIRLAGQADPRDHHHGFVCRAARRGGGIAPGVCAHPRRGASRIRLAASGAGVGALVMGMIIAHRPPMKKSGRNLLWAVADSAGDDRLRHLQIVHPLDGHALSHRRV